MSAAPSLRLRLLAGVLLAVALAWVGIAVAGYVKWRHELDELFDAHLAQSASMLVAQLSDEIDEIDFDHAPQLHRYARRVAFQIWERGRWLRLHSVSAPSERLSAVEDGFSDSEVAGVGWRVFSTWTEGHHALVQVGDLRAAREDVSAEIVGHLLLPLGVALPLLGLALALAIRRGLEPLSAVASAVSARDPRRLEPIVAGNAPREVLPLVERLNALFGRIGEFMDSERRFTADAAHELRTPIAAIRAQAQVARESTEAGERQHALDQVLAGCDRAARLIEQLLTLARLDAEQWPQPFHRCALTRIARDVLGELAQEAHARGIAVELTGEAAVTVAGDEALLRVLLRNLVDNAIRYSPAGTTVRVVTDSGAAGATLEVVDEGPGVAPQERARVLDRFYRVLGSEERGAGLGLSIVARIAALHGASLDLGEGPGGRGLSATVRFPITAPA